MSVFIGHYSVVTGLGWNVNLTTIGASWANEAVMGFSDAVNLAVGVGDTYGVTNMNYASGEVDLSEVGLPNILPDSDGFIEIEFFESFVDNAGTGDAFFEPGSTVTLYGHVLYPSPGTLAAFALGGLVAGRRRR